ncbi:MAG TPA: HAMP domain-containing sensor histidine kinase [Actinomycetes bacterium]|nr:HAMP domain-containing sensor histidine kinase [Actinomycetes bacterium]
MPNERSRPGFAARLLVGQALVLVAGGITTWVVASAVGPAIFHQHLTEAGVHHTAAESKHVEDAFSSALLISIAIALLAAVVAALVVSWYFSRRVQRSIRDVASAAGEIAAGRHGARVPDPGLGGEFTTLAATFNALADRLEATDTTRRRMLADLAHEMRTPLATIDAHLEAVEDGVRPVDQETIGVIRRSTRRLGRLAEDVTAVSRAEEGKLDISRVPVDASEIARAAVAVAGDRFGAKKVHLQLHDDGNAGPLMVDPDRMGQVLGNLLDNALRHTDAAGTVTLTTRRHGAWVELVVADNGKGIAAEDLDHVFDRFYRVDSARDRNHGGSGIGLAIAKALVEAHGGRITAASKGPGQGAVFTVRLPAGSGATSR